MSRSGSKQDRLRLRRVSTMSQKMMQDSYTSSEAVAVLTSGGDSQGMNAAVRAVIRMCIHNRVDVYAVKEGYDGLIKGGDAIMKYSWADVSNIMGQGGTFIGSARCNEFRCPEGRYTATVNLLRKNITQLIVIGGDGSLTGADYLQREWPNNVQKAVENGDLPPVAESKNMLKIYGIVGSIDNDFVDYEITIGTDTALHRICEAVSAIRDTAYSHRRAFVVQVMGRNCGYLALTAALCCEADYVLVPEYFQPKDWKSDMKRVISSERANGKRTSLVLVAEGAVDSDGNPISPNDVAKIMTEELNLDTRVSILGHMQRGGSVSAFDRIMATRLGADAALYIIDKEYNGAKVVSMKKHATVAFPMMESVANTKKIGEYIANKDFEQLIASRGKSFANYIKLFEIMNSCKGAQEESETKDKTVAIIHLGSPVVGMNPVTLCAARYFTGKGMKVLGVKNGLEGLQMSLTRSSMIQELTPKNTFGLMNSPGSILGTNVNNNQDTLDLAKVAEAIKKHKIEGMLIIGGNYALEQAKLLSDSKSMYPELDVPKIVLPCSITNDLPFTQFSIGTDSCLNQIIHLIDSIKNSNSGNGKTIFFVETRGLTNSLLPVYTALASGSCKCYTNDSILSLEDIIADARQITKQFSSFNVKFIICAEGLNLKNSMDIDSIMSIYEKSCNGEAKCVKVTLGCLQEGCLPSPQDKKLAMKFAIKSSIKLVEMIKAKDSSEDLILFAESFDGSEFYDKQRMSQKDEAKEDVLKWLSFIKALASRLTDIDSSDVYIDDIIMH